MDSRLDLVILISFFEVSFRILCLICFERYSTIDLKIIYYRFIEARTISSIFPSIKCY